MAAGEAGGLRNGGRTSVVVSCGVVAPLLVVREELDGHEGDDDDGEDEGVRGWLGIRGEGSREEENVGWGGYQEEQKLKKGVSSKQCVKEGHKGLRSVPRL